MDSILGDIIEDELQELDENYFTLELTMKAQPPVALPADSEDNFDSDESE